MSIEKNGPADANQTGQTTRITEPSLPCVPRNGNPLDEEERHGLEHISAPVARLLEKLECLAISNKEAA